MRSLSVSEISISVLSILAVIIFGATNIKAAPDHVSVTFEGVTTNAATSEAKRQNNVAAAKTLAVTKSFAISDDDLQTDRLTIPPRLAGDKGTRGNGTPGFQTPASAYGADLILEIEGTARQDV